MSEVKEVSPDTNKSDTELAQEANGKQNEESRNQKEEEEAEEVEEEIEEDEDGEREGGFSMLSKFSQDVLDLLMQGNEPLGEEERKPKPLPTAGKEYKDVIRLLQVANSFMNIDWILVTKTHW